MTGGGGGDGDGNEGVNDGALLVLYSCLLCRVFLLWFFSALYVSSGP